MHNLSVMGRFDNGDTTRLGDLQHLQAVLGRALHACQRGESRTACAVLQQLQQQASQQTDTGR